MASRLLFVLFSVLAVSLAQDLSQKYRFSAQLDGEDYVLYWNFSYEEQSIRFAVRVKTTGWIGFGLSPNGQMPQSDVVIGWVDNNGQAMLQDRFADGRNTPAIDALQSWTLVRGVENSGSTVLEFWRNFSTCDDRDREISKYSGQTYRIIWSYYPDDPTDPTGRFPMHTRQGNKSLNLLGGLQRQRTVPSDSDTFIVRNDKVTIPNNFDFTYWCSYQEHRVPPGDIYIYKTTPLITNTSVGYIQHMTFVVCPSYVDTSLLVNANGPCSDIQWLCYYGDGLGGWSNGGGTYTFPEDVALHVNLQANQRIFMSVHYDNPRLDAGVIDSSGMMFYYTRQRPVNIAGSVAVEFTTFPYLNLVIPPNAESFNITATCPNRCHDSTFPQNGITIFATFHHSNILGKASIARRSRQADGCDAVEELEPIDQNLQFDFKFQEYAHLQKPIVLQKDDTLSVTCTYDSKKANRQGVTLGGQSRRDEQCIVYFGYYPKRHLTFCGSYINPQAAYAPFLRRFLPEEDVNATLQHLNIYNPIGAANAFNRIQWTPQNISDFQQAIDTAQTVNGYCWYDNTHPSGSTYYEFMMNQSQPKFDCPYQYPNQCARTNTMSCCDRLRSGQLNVVAIAAGTAGGVVGLIIAVIVVAVIVVVAIIVVKGMAKAKANQGNVEKYSELVRKDSYKEEA